MTKKPKPRPAPKPNGKSALERMADFTKRIVSVPKHELLSDKLNARKKKKS